MKPNQVKMEFLLTKLSSLQTELKASKEIFDAATQEVEKLINLKGSKPEVKQDKHAPCPNLEERAREQAEMLEAENRAPPEIRNIFKKIATHCHPDKIQDTEDEIEKQQKAELYQQARTALEESDIVTLTSIAKKLGVSEIDFTTEHLRITEDKIKSVKKEISMIESTAVWHWFFEEEESKKDAMLKRIFEIIHGQNNFRP